VKISQIIKTTLGIASLFIFGLVFGEILKLTDNKDIAEKSRILYSKGIKAAEKGNNKESINLLSKSIKLDSTNIEARNCLGKILLDVEKYDETIECLNVKTVNAETLKIRGDAYFALENYSAAFVDYSESLKMSPNADVYIGLGNIFVKMDNLSAGQNSYTKAIEMESGRADYYFLRGKALSLQKKYAEAISDFDKALKIEPDNVLYKQNRDFVYSLQKAE
jgi:tetratricopeptide (TPR) repeat protein